MAHFRSRDTEKLVEELSNDIGTSKSARVIVPVCHIYLEHMMNIILEKNLSSDEFQKIKNDENFGFFKKLCKINELGLFTEDEYHDLELINQVRNSLVHEFRPDLEEIIQKIRELRFHQFNENRNHVDVILTDILHLMMFLEKKYLN